MIALLRPRGARIATAFGLILAASLAAQPALSQSFSGDWEFRWLSDPDGRHRDMELLSPVAYTDAAGKQWEVPAGTHIDGASIPALFWSIAGSPFVGNYRRASVIHDHYCVIKTELDGAVHLMFREAMITDGVNPFEAGVKYLAVAGYNFAGKGCGRPEDLVTMFSTTRDRFPSGDLGIDVSDEFLRSVEVWADSPIVDVEGLRTRIGAVNDTANVASPRTLAAMAAFRLDPNAENYAALDAAYRAEQPGSLEQEMLVLTTQATVPPQSVLVLPQVRVPRTQLELAPSD